MNISRSRLQYWGAACFFFALTIGLASSSSATLVWFPIFRIIFLSIFSCSMAMTLLAGRIRIETILSLFLVAVFCTYGVAQSLNESTFSLVPIITSFLIVSSGQIAFSMSQDLNIESKLALSYVYFAFATLIFLVFTGALILSPYLTFSYDFFATSGSQISYSQGMTQFFGIGAISSAWLLVRSDVRAQKFFLFPVTALFLLLSFLGGGRGETVFLIVVIFFFFFRNVKVIAAAVVLIGVVYFSDFLSFDFVQSLVFVNRLKEVVDEGYLGLRDVLFGQAIDLMADQPHCFVWGCGYYYFQVYYGYDIGFYPHNLLLESFIVFGFILTFLLVALSAIGLFKVKTPGFLGAVALYSILIGMKSGDVVNSWIALTYVFFLAGKGLSGAFRQKDILQEPQKNVRLG